MCTRGSQAEKTTDARGCSCSTLGRRGGGAGMRRLGCPTQRGQACESDWSSHMPRTNGVKSGSDKAAAILCRAQQLSTHVESWADFTNALFDPQDGLVARSFPRLDERQAFFES